MNLHEIVTINQELEFARARFPGWHWEQDPDNPTNLRYRSPEHNNGGWYYYDIEDMIDGHRHEYASFVHTGRL